MLTVFTSLLGTGISLPARADDGYQTLPLKGLGSLVVDSVHGREFVSGGWQDDTVVVAGADGAVIDSVSGLPGATGMTLSPDAATLYVALPNQNQVVAVGTADLRVKRTYDLGADTCPMQLATVADMVVFAGFCQSFAPDPARGHVGSLDPTTGGVQADLAGPWSDLPTLASSPTRPDVLVALGHRQQHPGPNDDPVIAVLHLSTAPTPRFTLTAQRLDTSSGPAAITSDGQSVVVGQSVLSLADLSKTGTMPGPETVGLVAVRGDGLVARAQDDVVGQDLFVFHLGDTVPLRSFDFSSSGTTGISTSFRNGALAFGADKLYAVLTSGDPPWGDFHPALRVLDPVNPPAMTITLTPDERVAAYGDVVKFTAHLGPGSANRRVELSSSLQTNDIVHGGGSFAHGYVDEHGNFSSAIPLGQTVEITATALSDTYPGYPGGATATVTIPVRADVIDTTTGGFATSGAYRLFAPRSRPRVKIKVKAPTQGTCTRPQVQVKRHGHWRDSRADECTRLDRSGRGTIALRPHSTGTRMRVRAVWSGTPHIASQAGNWAYVGFAQPRH